MGVPCPRHTHPGHKLLTAQAPPPPLCPRCAFLSGFAQGHIPCLSIHLCVPVPSGLRLWHPEHSTEPGCRQGLRLLLPLTAALPRPCRHVSWARGWAGRGAKGKGGAVQPGRPRQATYPPGASVSPLIPGHDPSVLHAVWERIRS